MTAWRAVVTGRVQGVGYRYHTIRLADRLGLSGWIRNRADGGVEILAQGPDDLMEELAGWLWIGPPGAIVDDIAFTPVEPDARLAAFTVRR